MKKITISLLFLGTVASSLLGGEPTKFGKYQPGVSGDYRKELLRIRKEQRRVAALALQKAKEKQERERRARDGHL
ncbi:hypothetical protein HOM50_01745 [bacterium]|jgi:hypothetical protein|nr:hypothetical protein [bacterium]MBT5015110.1 hypothetical protein [bacterium]